ncbi:ABC transporter ATP-binding protein [Rhodopirellula baltica]|nr:ABC transporter ATP-binding protein [Rhodopirellula baltica]
MLQCVSRRRRRQLLLLFALMIGSALSEIVSLGTVIPFLAILADPEEAMQRPIIASVVRFFGLGSGDTLRFQLTGIFASMAIIAGLIRFALIFVTARASFGIAHELGVEVYRRTLYQPYDVHVNRNSSEIVGSIGKVDVVAWAVAFLLAATGAAMMAIAIVGTLIVVDPLVSLIVLVGMATVYGSVSIFTRKKLSRNSKTVNHAYTSKTKTVQEGLGGIRDIVLDNTQHVFVDRFRQTDRRMRQAQASNYTIEPSPRFIIEAIGMSLIAVLACIMAVRDGTLANALPVLGALALGMQRLMPMVQQVYRGYVYVAANRMVIHDVRVLSQQPISQEAGSQITPVPFETSIQLQDVTFRYHSDSPDVLKQISLDIPKGSIVGFVGETGSGKSTLIDLIMGLLQSSSGCLCVDGTTIDASNAVGWQQNIAHVPQSIFLRDATFAENIAFGVDQEDIDMDRVRAAAQSAHIADFIEASPNGYQGVTGERGVRISGGQRQRIGIARAIYKNSPVLVLDEATSALDGQTESAVIESLLAMNTDLTVLMIAHRLSTLKNCDFIVKIKDGKIASLETQPIYNGMNR